MMLYIPPLQPTTSTGAPADMMSQGIIVIASFCAVIIIFGAAIRIWAHLQKHEPGL